MKLGVVQLVGVVLRRPPVVLRRGGGASMVGKMGELLHGLEFERECEGSEWDEGERARGALVEEGAWLTRVVGGAMWRADSVRVTRSGDALADRPRVCR